MTLPAGTADRFWRKIHRGDGCWLWHRRPNGSGYGIFQIARRSFGAHRVAWELTNGPIPEGLSVLHRCDVRTCVRPDHLFLGTQADNIADMMAKGRHRKDWKTVCLRGHALTPDNRYHGTGDCKACVRVRSQERRAARRQAAA